jgi:glycine/serine hydroxymethyltransferase
MVEADMERIAGWMVEALRHPEDTAHLERLVGEVKAFCVAFPVPGLAALAAE